MAMSPFDVLPTELLEQILIRLAVEIVHRCKSVCKRWLHLISSSGFYYRYTFARPQYHDSRFNLLFQDRGGLYQIPHCQLVTPPGFWFKDLIPGLLSPFVLASSNGLVLLCELSNLNPRYGYLVCNPFTRRWATLPPALNSIGRDSIRRADVGFSCRNYGGMTIYKVVIVPKFRFSEQFQVDIFSSDSNDWRVLRVSCPPRCNTSSPHDDNLVECKEVLHWLSPNKKGIVRYDPRSDPFSCNFIELPATADVKLFDKTLIGACRGRIRLGQIRQIKRGTDVLHLLSVWELVNAEWRFDVHCCLTAIIRSLIPGRIYGLWVVAFHPMDPDVVYIRLSHEFIFRCNMRSIIHDGSSVTSLKSYSGVHSYKASPFVLPWWPADPVPRRR